MTLHNFYYKYLTSGKLSNLVKSQRKQKSCMEIDDEIIKRHMVNMMRLPSFFPGPKTLYTKSSSIGDAVIKRTIRKTCRTNMSNAIQSNETFEKVKNSNAELLT